MDCSQSYECLVWMLLRLISSLVSGAAAVRARQMRNPDFRPSTDIPAASRSGAGLAMSMGLFSNVRYQAVSGLDRLLSERINFMWVYLLLSASFRAASQLVGQPTRLYLQVSSFPPQLQPLLIVCLTSITGSAP